MSNQPPPSRARSALRRLLWIVVFTLGLIIFAYGWTVTNIDLDVPQEERRQENVGNALRELLSPNVFTQDYEVLTATTAFQIGCTEDFVAPLETATLNGPRIEVEPACGDAGDIVTVRGYDFASNGLARVNWLALDGERRIRQVDGTSEDNFNTLNGGGFEVQIEVPRIRGTIGQTHTIEVQGRFPVGAPRFSETTTLVLEKMVETIFLALIATAVSILPAAILSFLAAYNLMRPIRMQLGTLLLSMVLLPLGAVLGAATLGRLGELAVNVGQGDFASIGAAAFIVLGTVTTSRRLRPSEPIAAPAKGRQMLSALLVAVVVVIAIGLIGGLGLLFERTFTDTPALVHISGFIGSLGQMIELTIVPIGAILGAITLSSIGGNLAKSTLKDADAGFAHLLGAILGGLAGAILLGVVAVMGTSAAWLTLLPAIAAAGLASAILPQMLARLGMKVGAGWPRRLLSWLGALGGFALTFWVLNLRQSLVEGVVPAQAVAFDVLGTPITYFVLYAMLIGLALGALNGGLIGTHANFPIGGVMYNITRTVLNALRSIEPLIMGLVFVIWVGIGPFAGVLALALHSVASLGKLYSEQIENIDSGPIEALQSTGANRLQTIIYAVVPQIIPSFIAFTMYRWDINVRMSTIVGFVGGGGIGFLLQQQINLLRYRDAGVAVLAIAIVVSVLDYASAAIRERYT